MVMERVFELVLYVAVAVPEAVDQLAGTSLEALSVASKVTFGSGTGSSILWQEQQIKIRNNGR